jgi:hypothetical protein
VQSETRFLSLSMYTYCDLLDHGREVIRFVEQELELVKPWSQDLRARPMYPGGTFGHISKLNQRTQERLWHQLRVGKFESLRIAQKNWHDDFMPPEINIELDLANHTSYWHYQRLRYPILPEEYNDLSAAKSLHLAVNCDLLDSQSHQRLFDALVDLGLWTIEVLDAVYGFVSLGSFGPLCCAQTPYEKRYLLSYESHLRRALLDKCRGVFLINFLTEGHIAALGDITHLASLSVVDRVESVKAGTRGVLILRLGDGHTALDETQELAIEDHLAPILPQQSVELMVDLLNTEIAQGMAEATPELEAMLSPEQVVIMPNGGMLLFHSMEVFGRLAVFYQRYLGNIPWHGPVAGIYPGWRLFRVDRQGKHLERMPDISSTTLIDVKPFETTLWLGSEPAKRIEQTLAELLIEWAGFEYPDYTGEKPAIDLLEFRFQGREVTVRAEIRAHQGFALATLVSMLDLFSLKQARISDLVLGQIEDLDSLLARAGHSRDSLPESGDSQESRPRSDAEGSPARRSPQLALDPQTKADPVSIPIIIGDIFEPPDIPITIRFAYPPDEVQRAALQELLYAWFLDGQNEVFGPGFFHSATSVVFEDELALWHVDIGSSSSDAIDVLKNRLEDYGKVHVPVEELMLGTGLD